MGIIHAVLRSFLATNCQFTRKSFEFDAQWCVGNYVIVPAFSRKDHKLWVKCVLYKLHSQFLTKMHSYSLLIVVVKMNCGRHFATLFRGFLCLNRFTATSILALCPPRVHVFLWIVRVISFKIVRHFVQTEFRISSWIRKKNMKSGWKWLNSEA